MGENNKDKQQDEYLKKFLKDKSISTNTTINEISNDIKIKSGNDLDFLNVDLDMLPMGMFYQPGTKIKIRAAKVQEVQAYSVVDDRNIVDVTEKMNQLLASCSTVILPNGKKVSYKHIKDGDRLFIVFMIRELTFISGNSLSKNVTCNSCKREFAIPYRATANKEYARTIYNYDMPEELEKFFNEEKRCFVFNINNANYELAPPTIGIQEAFYEDMKKKVQAKKEPNVAFLKIIPYMLYNRTSISEDGIFAKEDEFKRMNMKVFQILTQAVDKMKFGSKELIMKCPVCNEEVHTEMTFPKSAASLFIIPDFFGSINKK